MRPRDLLILSGLLVLGATVGIVVLSSDSHADELPPGARTAAETPAAAPVPVAVPADAAQGGSLPAEASLVEDNETERIDTSGWTTGTVMGDIAIAVSILDQITTIMVCVEEMRSPIARDGTATGGTFRHPHKYMVPVKMGVGTPTFVVTDIAFSEYPYCVSLYAPGLNGGRCVVVIDKKNPLHNNLELRITPGSPFSVLLRDQDQNPYPNIDVRLVPVGDPLGRSPHSKVTDNFGSVVFENVLSGDYQIITGQNGMPLGPPETIHVGPGERLYGPKVQGQSYVVTVPRGQPLQVSVSCGGYGAADARIKLTASDRTKLTVLEAVSDYSGRAEFPHLTPGVWLIEVLKDNHEPRTRQITIKDGEPPPVEQVVLFRKR